MRVSQVATSSYVAMKTVEERTLECSFEVE